MGYDSRLYIVEKSRYSSPIKIVIEDEDYGYRNHSQVIASIDIGVYPVVAEFMRAQPETDCYIYAHDGNTMIVTDLYDKIMTECSLADLMTVVQSEIDRGVDYRRLFPLYGLLKGFVPEQWDNLRVLHFGH